MVVGKFNAIFGICCKQGALDVTAGGVVVLSGACFHEAGEHDTAGFKAHIDKYGLVGAGDRKGVLPDGLNENILCKLEFLRHLCILVGDGDLDRIFVGDVRGGQVLHTCLVEYGVGDDTVCIVDDVGDYGMPQGDGAHVARQLFPSHGDLHTVAYVKGLEPHQYEAVDDIGQSLLENKTQHYHQH